MTGATHTPRPWIVEGDDRPGYFDVCRGETVIAELIEREDDARLIAAAPDMLEALRFFADPPTTSETAWWRAKDAARAAIAKATSR